MKFGCHVSIAGGIDKAPERAHVLGCECFQIFSRSPRGGKPAPLTDSLVASFKDSCAEFGLSDYFIHTPYYINLASEKPGLRASSVRIIREELERGTVIGAKYVMTHLGSSKGIDRPVAVGRVVEGVAAILEDSGGLTTELLLENTAGQGETIGDSFPELARIINEIESPGLGVCLDTAHLLASGYDIRTKAAVDKTLDEFSSLIDPARIRLLHGNDSKIPLGEKKDRHEHIGEGKIGTAGFKAIVNHPLLKGLDMIVEIPPEEVERDIQLLKSLRKK